VEDHVFHGFRSFAFDGVVGRDVEAAASPFDIIRPM
jgi:hypothetical protein